VRGSDQRRGSKVGMSSEVPANYGDILLGLSEIPKSHSATSAHFPITLPHRRLLNGTKWIDCNK
jgi:hypothetical protein